MNHRAAMPAVDWAKRVNRSWITRSNLSDHAEAWMQYLARMEGDRLEKSCEIARDMCAIRNREIDPKPWFYSGLFSLATRAEAKYFISSHRLTKAIIPTMRNQEDVLLWMDRVGPETDELVNLLRQKIDQLILLSES